MVSRIGFIVNEFLSKKHISKIVFISIRFIMMRFNAIAYLPDHLTRPACCGCSDISLNNVP